MNTFEMRAELGDILENGYPIDTPRGRERVIKVLLGMLDILEKVEEQEMERIAEEYDLDPLGDMAKDLRKSTT